MNRTRNLLAVILLLLLLGTTAEAQPEYSDHVLDYLWFSVSETTPFGEILWFYNGDILSGPVRSNDAIPIRGEPIFYDIVVTTADEPFYGPNANPQFLGPDPVYGAPPLNDVKFIYAHEIVAAHAMQTGDYWDNEFGDGYLQTRVIAEEAGWHIFQWSAGTPFDEAVIVNDSFEPYGERAFYFEGRVEVMGTHVQGQTSIASSGNMYLLDDVIYDGMPQRVVDNYWTPFLEYDGPERLVLIAQNILVANTPANGRGNGGYDGQWNDHSNKHIRISAQLITPRTSYDAIPQPIGAFYSFSFENQNNAPDDPYGNDGYWWCDPDGQNGLGPDERGKIFLYGSVAQYQRGYVHRSNCGGTGYERVYAFDDRFPGANLPATIAYQTIDLTQGDVTWQDTTVVLNGEFDYFRLEGHGMLTLGSGTRILSNYPDSGALFRGGRMQFAGTAAQPVVIESGEHYGPTDELKINRGVFMDGSASHLKITAPSIEVTLPRSVSDVEFVADRWIHLGGESVIRNSFFRGELTIGHLDVLEKCVVEGHLTTHNANYLNRVTFAYRAGYSGPAIRAWTSEPDGVLTFRNIAFYGGYESLIETANPATLSYSTWWDLEGDQSLVSDSVTVLEGTLTEANPLFWNPMAGDYHLTEGSPLIDAGDPDSDLDPDGSRADIGAFPYDPTYTEAPEVDPESGLPMAFGIENLYPNPFNGVTTLSLTLPRSGEVEVIVVDMLGRQVEVLHRGVMRAGRSTLSANLATHPSGLYFIVAQTGSQRSVAKAMLVK